VGGYGKVSRKCDKGELAKESKIILFKSVFYKIGKAGGNHALFEWTLRGN